MLSDHHVSPTSKKRDKREQEIAEAERKRSADLAAAHREEEKQNQMEQDRESRMMTREQRIKDRGIQAIACRRGAGPCC